MQYVEGFVAAVPTANREAYVRHASDAAPLFRSYGVSRMVECWADDVPDGKVTDFRRAVKAKDDETVVFSWLEYPSRDVRDTATEQIMADPRMAEMGKSMPFDGSRMIFGGFVPILDEISDGTIGYVDGFLIAVPTVNKVAYRTMAEKAAAMFRDHGATRIVENWGDDVPEGKITDYKGAVQAKPDETVVYSWIEWPSKEARVAGWEKVMADKRMEPDQQDMPFDGKRMIYGGFMPVLDR